MAVREQEVLAVSINMYKRSLVSVDVGQNIVRATKWVKPNSLPTVTPAAKTYLTVRRNGKPINRFLLGYEAMLFQGLPANLWTKTTKLSDPQMMNLAGNAFPSTQCAAVMIAIFANLPAKMPQQNLSQCAREEAELQGKGAEPEEVVKAKEDLSLKKRAAELQGSPLAAGAAQRAADAEAK